MFATLFRVKVGYNDGADYKTTLWNLLFCHSFNTRAGHIFFLTVHFQIHGHICQTCPKTRHSCHSVLKGQKHENKEREQSRTRCHVQECHNVQHLLGTSRLPPPWCPGRIFPLARLGYQSLLAQPRCSQHQFIPLFHSGACRLRQCWGLEEESLKIRRASLEVRAYVGWSRRHSMVSRLSSRLRKSKSEQDGRSRGAGKKSSQGL